MTPLSTLLRMLPALLLACALLPDLAAARSLKDYQHIVWTRQHGLPSGIRDMAHTTDGWLWIGSDDGLFRFDGVNFEPYRPPGHPELAHKQVGEMHAADNGDLVVSYFPTGVAVLRRDGSFTLLPAHADLPRVTPVAMQVDRDGGLWTIGDGIHHYANGRWESLDRGAPWASDAAYSLLLDQEDRLWAATPAGVWKLDRKRRRFDQVTDASGGLALSPSGDVWLIALGGGKATRLAKGEMGKARPARAGAVVSRHAGLIASDGKLWALGCPDMACLVHDMGAQRDEVWPARDAGERVASPEGAAGRADLTILEDREGNIWIHGPNGLNQFRPKRFLIPEPRLELADFSYSAAADGAGNLWVAERATGKLMRMGPDGVPVTVPDAMAQRLATGSDGSLLMADRQRIVRMTGASAETILLPPGPDGKPLDRQLFGLLDDGKRVWTAAPDTGSIAWADGKWQASTALGVPRKVYLSQAGGPGQLWLMLLSGELVFYDDRKLIHYDARLVGTATGIFPGTPLVLGGSDGLAVLKDGKFHLLRSAEPDTLRGISGMAVTADGDRWLNGLAGVVHVRAADWQRALDRPGEMLRYELFGAVDGYPGRATMEWRSPTAISADGRHVWFGTTNGIVGLDTGNLRRNAAIPHPALLEVSTDTTRFDAAQRLRLPPGSQDFRIRFTAPTLRQPERARFEYRLDGFDANWRDAGSRRTTSYTNVPPGDYTFRVRAFNEDGLASTQDAAMSIAIEPTWVQSAPFKVALALVVAALLAMLYRLRVRYLTRRITERIEIKTAERERIARTLHDSFLQTVYVLLLRLRKYTAGLPGNDGTHQELRAILDDTRKAIDEGRDQVHELRIKRSVEEIVRECASSLRALHPDIGFELRSDGAPGEADQGLVDDVGAIACEALRNAYTHGQARHIAVAIVHGKRELSVSVQDDGRGIDPDVLDAGRRDGHWGLVGMRERAAHIGARLELGSDAGAGTLVKLSVPLA